MAKANKQYQRQQERQPPQVTSLRESASSGESENTNRWVGNFLIAILIMSILNVLAYNTKFFDFKADAFDIIWACATIFGSLFGILIVKVFYLKR
jgi:hypothetical protein